MKILYLRLMKRMISVILLMIMLTLQLMPCADHSAFAAQAELASMSDAGYNHHQESRDQCPPFCYCNCCASHAVVKISVHVYLLNSVHSPVYKVYPTGKYRDISLPVWQPPKLFS